MDEHTFKVYRVWRTDMRRIDFITLDPRDGSSCVTRSLSTGDVGSFTCMEEYAGENDLVDSPVFVGDIISPASIGGTISNAVVVRGSDGSFCAKQITMEKLSAPLKWLNEPFNIIGNIHQNKDLLGRYEDAFCK